MGCYQANAVEHKPGGIPRTANVHSQWDDPEVGIQWPIRDAQLSDKDRKAQTLKEWLARPESEHFKYSETETMVGR